MNSNVEEIKWLEWEQNGWTNNNNNKSIFIAALPSKKKKENYHLNKIAVAASDYVEASYWSGLPWYRNFFCSLVDNNQT